MIADAGEVHRSGVLPGVRWGMPTIDRAMDRLIDRDTLTLLGGLPGSGKTALVAQMGKSLGLRVLDEGIERGLSPEQAMRQRGMLLISLEMTAGQIALRLAAHEAGLNAEDIRNGRMDEMAAISLMQAEQRTRFMAMRYSGISAPCRSDCYRRNRDAPSPTAQGLVVVVKTICSHARRRA